MGLLTLTNTEYFSEAANDFKRNKGVYTKAPYGSKEYTVYWAIQKDRCLNGYTVGDLSITGRHYFYLNFCPIKRTRNDGKPIVGMQAKELLFPAFWEIDYHWWWAKEISMKGMMKEQVAALKIEGLPIIDYTTGKHLSCLKTRRAGFSYKEAADGVYNYNFIPNSKSYYFASGKPFLEGDGILTKVTDYLTHLNSNTQRFWRKNRMVKDTIYHRRASYYDKRKDEKGYMSEIMGVVIDDPNKVRGKDGIKITYEEAGSFKNLKAALAISMPSVNDGGIMTGQISVFGTGGEEGPDIEGLEEIFGDPEAYDMLAWNNIWEEGMEATKCGYFVPCFRANQSFMDDAGNVNIEGAIAFDENERNKKKKLKDPKELDRRIAEFPRTPSEALQRVSANIFPVAEITNWIKRVEHDKDLQSSILHGVLFQGKTSVEFSPSSEVKPLLQFPHKNDDDLTGCVTIYDKPERDTLGVAVPGKYFAVVDPYYKDQAEDRTSLWACYIFKQKKRGDPSSNKMVASYIARPTALRTAYRNTVLLTQMYNGTIQSEIAGGGQGLFDYLREKKLLHLAEYQPELFTTSEKGVNVKNRSYFMNISTEEKKNGASYLADWLMEQVGINSDGQPVYNLHRIYDIAFLKELIKFNPAKGNFDRISAFIVAMYMLKEKELFGLEQEKSKSGFYNRAGFGEYSGNSSTSEYLDAA